VWFDFRGGKGAATVVASSPRWNCACWCAAPELIIVLLLFGYVVRHHAVDDRLTAAVLVLEPNNIHFAHFVPRSPLCNLYPSHNIARMCAGKKIGCGVYGCFDRERLALTHPPCCVAGGRRSALRRIAGGGAAPNPRGGVERR